VTASTTTNRDFKVKHGLSVAEGGTFGSAVTVGTPTENTHAATKLYVDSKPLLVATASTAPADASNGQLYVDTIENRLSFYYNGQWNTIALLNDTIEIAQHIHDTAIDGTGLIVSTFKDAGFYNEAGASEDAGFYNTNSWSVTYDGGIATEVFN
jgi:uncharacterized membrane protein